MDEAIKWWERASKGGNVVAQFALGQAYYQGDAVEQDLEKAYTWVMVSANPKSKSQRRYQKASFSLPTGTYRCTNGVSHKKSNRCLFKFRLC